MTIDIRSARHLAPGDPRPLGVRLDRITIVNAPPSQLLASVRAEHVAIIVAAGAIAWIAGLWILPVASAGASSNWPRVLAGTASVGVLAIGLLLWRPWILQTSGLRALAGAVLLGAVMGALLRRGDACSRRLTAVVAVAAATTWLVLALWASQHFVDAPRWDIWETVPLIEKALAGSLTPADMWSAHNEHRPMTGRLVVIGSAVFAHWNHWYELAALLASAGLQLAVLTAFVAASQRCVQRVHPATLVAIAVIACSSTQWENWLRGYHVHILMGGIAPVAALLVLTRGASSWARLVLAAGLGVLGELSFGTGLLTWPIGALVIAVRRGEGWRMRLGVWLSVAAVAIALYFPGLPESPGRAEGLTSVLSGKGLVRLIAGTLVTIAMPIAYVPQVFTTPLHATQYAVVVFGGVAVLLWLALVWVRWREDTTSEFVWLFPAALAAFGLAACALAGLGRASMGLYAMTASRYLGFAACFWSGVLMLLGMPRSRATRTWVDHACLVVLLAIGIAAAAAWPAALPFMDQDALDGRRARAQLRRGAVGDAAGVLYPDPFVLERRRAVLLEHRLSVFRPGVTQ